MMLATKRMVFVTGPEDSQESKVKPPGFWENLQTNG